MQPTQRTFTNVETNQTCRLYTSNDASKYHLIYEGQPKEIADGSEVNGFYLAAHTGVTIKINNKKIVFISSGQFYPLKEGEKVTHKKYVGFNKFTKV